MRFARKRRAVKKASNSTNEASTNAQRAYEQRIKPAVRRDGYGQAESELAKYFPKSKALEKEGWSIPF
jgi:hypothetical protein